MGGALKLLQLGQTVRIQRLEHSCSLTIVPAGEEGLKVVEVGVDYAVFEDESEGVQTRIPMHLLKMATGDPDAAPAVALPTAA